MESVALLLLIFFIVVGFAAIFFTTFGTFIMMAGTLLYAVMTDFEIITPKLLGILFVLYVIGELLEFIFTVIGAKKFGASNAAAVGAVAGGVLGAVIGTGFFGIGIIPGTFCGIFLGAFLVEQLLYKEWRRSFNAGVGSLAGRIGSIVAKCFIAIIMVTIIITRVVSVLY